MSATLEFSGDDEGWLFWPYLDEGAGVSMPRGYIDGLILNNNDGDPDHTIDISPGEVRSIDDDADMKLPSGISKILNEVFAEGDGQGGLDTGSVAPNTWYYVWIIKRTDNGTVDALFSVSSIVPTMPDGYNCKQCIMMVKTDSSSNIIPFTQYGDAVIWTTRVTEVNAAAGPNPETTVTLSGVPAGFVVKALLQISATSATPGDSYTVRPIIQTTGVAAEVICQVDSIAMKSCQFECFTSDAARVNHLATDSDVTVSMFTNGWIFERGKNGY
jgi:hypothetical protein